MYSGSHSFHPNDFSKTVLSWTFETLAAPLEIAMQQAPLPKREQSVARYYSNFIALILEEARAIIASGLEQVDQYIAQSSRKGKKEKGSSQFSDAKPFNLVLKKQANYPRNESNPLSMTFRGAIPEKIEHGKSMNVLLLKTKGITPEKQFIALATENPDSSELFVKIVMTSADYYSYQVCFSQDREWQAHYLGSVISEQRMYDVCLEATDIPCVQQIARGKIHIPNVTRVSTGSVDLSKMNLSQKESIFAFLNAREESTLLLQGPPGTGKTTTLVSLLKQVAALGKRTMVCAHSNKGVQVLALRAANDISDVPMIVVGVESKLPEPLKPHFLNRWYDIIQSRLMDYHDEVELFAQGKFRDLPISIADIIANIEMNIVYVLQALNKFNLIHSRQLSSENRQNLFALSQDPISMSDFQSFQTHINTLKQQSNDKKQWGALLGVLNRLIDKWTRISKEALESHLLDHASIVFSTLISAGRKGMLSMAPIDFLLVDEAAQSVEAATLIPMRYQPSKVLLVGDTKQLPATVISRALDDSDGRRSSKNYKWSMMWRLIEELNQPSLMLTIQYRMHPHICQWPSGQYYADRLITSPDILPMPLLNNTSITSRPYAIYQVSGHTESQDGSHSICNAQEAQYVIRIIEHIRRQNKTQSIGVITPYAAQKRLISDGLFKKRHLQPLVDVNTVDGFQGDERDIIIISFTRTHVSEFLKEFRRLNVAITRPKACLIILGAPTLLSNDIGQLMTDARHRQVLYTEQELNHILTTGTVPTIALPASSAAVNLRDSAWRGHSHHQFHYAKTFEISDWEMFFLWSRRSAENNYPEAQLHLSHIYLSDHAIVKKDIQLGVSWLNKSAQNGFPPAQFTLGKFFILGEIIVKNVDAGISYCNQAADNGVIEALLFLAKCYDEGIGVTKNSKQAETYYRRAAKLDDVDSIVKLAALLANGTPDNQREAIKWYRKAAERNIVATYYPLANLLNTVFDSQIEALKWYLKAAENGDQEAQYELGLRFKHGHHACTIDIPRSTHFFKLAAIAGHAPAQFVYAMCLKEGSGVEASESQAMHYFKKAADSGDAEASYQFALLQSKNDRNTAYPYYLKAARQNHSLAQTECIHYQIQCNRDLTYCLRFCEQLVDQGNLQIQFILARLLDTGIAGKTDKARAYQYYLPLANANNALAHYYCALIIEAGIAIDQDVATARRHYEACIEHCIEAKPRLARLLLQTEDYVAHERRAIALIESYYARIHQEHRKAPLTLEQYLEDLICTKLANPVTFAIDSINTLSIHANYSLGIMLKDGVIVARNNAIAMAFLRKAADSGHAESQYQWALEKSKTSVDEAYPYFKKAALQHHALAQYECIHYQIKFNRDLADCLNFCELLVSQHDPQIQFLLARLLDTGISGKIDKARACHYYSLLANNGHHLAQYYCGIILEEGIGVAQDLTRARQYYESCQEQCLDAKLRLACLLLEKEDSELQTRQATSTMRNREATHSVELDIFCIPRRREIASLLQSPILTESQEQAATLLEFYYTHYEVTCSVSPKTIEQYLEKIIAEHSSNPPVYFIRSVAINSARINYLLGKILQEGKGVEIDIKRALQFYQLANAAYPDANYRIGYIYETGLNGNKNWPIAKGFYQRAADKGHELAAKRLTWSYSIFAWSSVPDDATLRRTEASNCLIM